MRWTIHLHVACLCVTWAAMSEMEKGSSTLWLLMGQVSSCFPTAPSPVLGIGCPPVLSAHPLLAPLAAAQRPLAGRRGWPTPLGLGRLRWAERPLIAGGPRGKGGPESPELAPESLLWSVRRSRPWECCCQEERGWPVCCNNCKGEGEGGWGASGLLCVLTGPDLKDGFSVQGTLLLPGGLCCSPSSYGCVFFSSCAGGGGRTQKNSSISVTGYLHYL